MNRLLLLLTVAIGLALPASAQKATAKLYAKAVGDDVLVAIQVSPEFGCWFYDQAPDPGGTPTEVVLGELAGADWTPVAFPEPTIKEDPYAGTARIFKKKTVLYAAAVGAAAAGVDPSAVTAHVEGQVCNERLCLKFEHDLTFRSAGTEKVWAGFPKALLAANAAPAPASAPGAAAEPQGDGAPDAAHGSTDAPTWSPIFGADKAKARVFAREVEGGEEGEVELVIQIATPEHWHVYHGPTSEEMGPGIGSPTKIEVEGGNVDWGDVQYPQPIQYVQGEAFPTDWLWAHEGTSHFGVRGEAYDDFDPDDITVTVVGQSCDPGSCVPVSLELQVEGEGEEPMYLAALAAWEYPVLVDGTLTQEDYDAQQAAGEAEGTVDAAGSVAGGSDAGGSDAAGSAETSSGEGAGTADAEGDEEDSLLGFILLAIGAGLFTLMMPCTYPMIPITISFFTKQAEQKKGNLLSLAVLYGLGIVLMFVAIGVTFGPLIVLFATHPTTNLVIGTVFVVFAFALFGMITLNPPASMMNLAAKAGAIGGYFGVFLMGLTLVITSFTCTGPFVGSLIAAGAEGGIGQIVIGMGVFGMTMATPFVLLALVPGKLSAMPSAGGWMNTLKVFMGFVELAAALKFFSNADIAVQAGIITREVFLMIWAGIAFVAAMFLLGRINLKGESPDGNIGPGRMLSGTVTFLLGLYCWMGVQGYKLDGFIMGAMAPPPGYSRGLVETHKPAAGLGTAAKPLPEGAKYEEGGIVFKDDYDAALAYARAEGLELFLNFTGHT